MNMRILCVLFLSGLSGISQAVVIGQSDNFEDGTVMGWIEGAPSPNMPTNISSGGPAGAGDNYLENQSSGGFGAGSRLVSLNRSQWAGDYTADNISGISVDFKNTGTGVLDMRIALQNSTGTRYGSATAFQVSADGSWHNHIFDFSDLTNISGTGTLNDVLSDVVELRVLVAGSGPAWIADAVVGSIGMDNISAVPLPGALFLFASGLIFFRPKSIRSLT